jgi:hypothetical protein
VESTTVLRFEQTTDKNHSFPCAGICIFLEFHKRRFVTYNVKTHTVSCFEGVYVFGTSNSYSFRMCAFVFFTIYQIRFRTIKKIIRIIHPLGCIGSRGLLGGDLGAVADDGPFTALWRQLPTNWSCQLPGCCDERSFEFKNTECP